MQEQLRLFCQDYDKIWEETWAPLPATARLPLRDEEMRFRATLKNTRCTDGIAKARGAGGISQKSNPCSESVQSIILKWLVMLFLFDVWLKQRRAVGR
jgi:hypothetical protein